MCTADNEASLNTENPSCSLFIEQFCGDFKCVIVFLSFKFLLCTARTSEHCQEHLNKEEFATSADTSPINTYCIWSPRCKLYILLLKGIQHSLKCYEYLSSVAFNPSVLHLTNVLYLFVFLLLSVNGPAVRLRDSVLLV